jgi:hypothetical protein
MILASVVAPVAMAATDTYINNGIVTAIFPPVPAPDIDTINFVNNGFFGVTNFFDEALSTPMVPYSTWDTVNYTNRSRMLGDPGFRFNLFDSSTSLNRWSANFVNANSVNDSNASVYGASYVLIAATNVVNHGTLAIGGPGLLNINGSGVDLTRGLVAAVGNDTNTIAGVQDRFWGVSTNIFSGLVDPNFFSPGIPATTIVQGFYAIFFPFFQFNQGFNSYVRITPTGPTSQTVDALYLSQTNAGISTEVRFGFPLISGSEKVVQWTGTVTNRVNGTVITNTLYLDDTLNFFTDPFPDPMFFQTWLIQTFRANLFYTLFSAATFHPINYSITRAFPFFNFLTPIQPVAYDPSIYFGTNFPVWVTNTTYGAIISASPFSPDPTIQGSTFTNVPGRIEIAATKALDLTRTRIDGQSYLSLKSTNHFIGSSGAQIFSPVSDINLATTNQILSISNLVRPDVPRMNGEIDIWSGRWTNTDVNGISSTYSVTVVDSRLRTAAPSLVQDLKLRAPQLVISDILNVFSSFLLDTERLTVTTNDANAPSITGEINLTSGNLLWSAGLPRLQYLTNFGKISSSNSIYFAGARRPPFFTGTFDEPYQAFVNHGILLSQGNDTWANYYEFSGTNFSGNGPLTVRASTAIITNGAFVTDADIAITSDTLLISNQVLQAARSISLSVGGSLTDGFGVTNANVWTAGDGFNILVKPAVGDLLTTTITNNAAPEANVVNRSAAQDRGCVPDGFQNNAAVGRMVLNGRENSLFTFSAQNGNNAIYIDSLELIGFTATNRDIVGNFSPGLFVEPGMKLYFGQALADGAIVAEKLNGLSDGRLCWVSNYNCGFFSSTNLLYPDGTTNRVNIALALSCDIDSNGNGIPNCMDPAPIPGGGGDCVIPPVGGGSPTNVPPTTGGGSSGGNTNSASGLPTLAFHSSPGSPVVPNAFPPGKTIYNGLFYDPANVGGPSSGFFTAKATDNRGGFSASLVMANGKKGFSGRFDASGRFSATVPKTTLNITLQIDLNIGDQIHGTVSDGHWSAVLLADRQVAAGSKAGNYTLVIPGDVQDESCPAGDGFGSVTIDAAGGVKWSGSLADGSKVTQATGLSKQSYLPLYVPLYSGKGALVSWIQLTNQPNSDLNGKLIWLKAAGSISKYYPAGFTNQIATVGASYHAPSPGTRAINITHGELMLAGGGLQSSLTNSLTLGLNNRATAPSGAQLTLTITPSTGLFKGSTLNPETGKPVSFQGILFKKANIGVGYFLGADQSGEVYLSPAK